jgi:hypothetical protein
LLLAWRRGLRCPQALAVALTIGVALTGVGLLPHALHIPQEQAHPQLGRFRRTISQSGHFLPSLLEHRF